MIKWPTYLLTHFFCQYVGQDTNGNRYYLSKHTNAEGYKKRLVLYKGSIEASKVPPMWHAWLHYIIDNPPPNINKPRYNWQKTYIPNLTGTKHAYLPNKTKYAKKFWKPNAESV